MRSSRVSSCVIEHTLTEVAIMPEKHVARLADEQRRGLEALTLRRGGKVGEIEHNQHPPHDYTGEPYRAQVRNLRARPVG